MGNKNFLYVIKPYFLLSVNNLHSLSPNNQIYNFVNVPRETERFFIFAIFFAHSNTQVSFNCSQSHSKYIKTEYYFIFSICKTCFYTSFPNTNFENL